jgi:hypothetical protein
MKQRFRNHDNTPSCRCTRTHQYCWQDPFLNGYPPIMNKVTLDRYMENCEDCYFDRVDYFAWKLFATLTFQRSLRFSQCRDIFGDWLRTIEIRAGTPFEYYFAVFEHDCSDTDARFYILLGGSEISFQRRLIIRWQDLSGGDATFDDYRQGAFATHVIDETQADHCFEVDFYFGGTTGYFDNFYFCSTNFR